MDPDRRSGCADAPRAAQHADGQQDDRRKQRPYTGGQKEDTLKRNLMFGIVLTLGLVIGATGARLLGAQPAPFKATDLLKADVVGMRGSRS